jgi:hypothetical protein
MAKDKAEWSEYIKEYTLKNNEKINQQRRERYAKHIETRRAKDRARWESRKEKAKEYKLQKLYGISLSDWHKLHIEQKGCCAICNDLLGLTQINVDHCHTSGIVRGLLCNRCNTLLGNAKDDTQILENAITYLKKINKASKQD